MQLQGDKKAIYMGANFDGSNLNVYGMEIKWRIGLAEQLGNIQVGIKSVLNSTVV